MEKAGTDPFSECRQVLRRRIPVSGRHYVQDQHGFARDYVLERVEESPASVTHRLVSNAETRKVYPFDFELMITIGWMEIKWIYSGR